MPYQQHPKYFQVVQSSDAQIPRWQEEIKHKLELQDRTRTYPPSPHLDSLVSRPSFSSSFTTKRKKKKQMTTQTTLLNRYNQQQPLQGSFKRSKQQRQQRQQQFHLNSPSCSLSEENFLRKTLFPFLFSLSVCLCP
mmetsp:Transcript_35211/g.54940  ORF Transcript_35211/g.54940 Transcript_35211/m.54940 type:complete len:136 (-) Transcript_35211:42-449(-)